MQEQPCEMFLLPEGCIVYASKKKKKLSQNLYPGMKNEMLELGKEEEREETKLAGWG